MTALGWIFMLSSTLSVTALVIWCFARVLSTSPQAWGKAEDEQSEVERRRANKAPDA